MIWGLLGLGWTAVSFGLLGYSIYDIVSTGSWRNWGIFDWILNIGVSLWILKPFYTAFRGATMAKAITSGSLFKRLESIPLIGKVLTFIYFIYQYVKTALFFIIAPFFRKGGFLSKVGEATATIGKTVKKPWVMFGLIFATTLADGIFRHVYQLWGDLTLRAANVAYEMVGNIMSGGGYGNPIDESIAILRGAKSDLPVCFTAVWGAVGASECIGLIMTTFQYLFLLAALVKGYKVVNR